MRITWLVVLIASLVIVSCGLETTGPTSFEAEGLEIQTRVEPATIPAGDSAEIAVVFRNVTDSSIHVGTAMGCPFFLTVLDRNSGDRVYMEGTGYGCLAVISGFEVPAADSVVRRQPVIARVNGSPMMHGHYKAHLDFTTGAPDLEVAFEVR